MIAYAWSSGRPVVVEATGTIRVQPGLDPSIQDRTDAVLAAVQYAAEMESPGFAQSVINELGLDEARDDLLKRLSFEVDTEAEVALIQMAVQTTDPQEAQAITKAFGDELIARKTDQLYTADVRDATQQVRRLQTDADALRRRLSNLRNKANKQPEDFAQIASLPGQIASLQEAIVGLRPYTSQYVRNLPAWYLEPRLPSESVAAGPLYWTLLAVVAGGMAAMGLAFVIEYLRTLGKVREERDLELATGQATLGEVIETRGDARRKDADRMVMLHYPKSDEAEAYRALVARIGFTGGTARTLMVTSARATDTKSLVAANIAIGYAEAGRNVILVDADYRTPHIHSFFGVKNDRGLSSILSDSNVPLGWATVPSPHPRLGLMTSGPMPRENAEPLGSRQLNALLRRLLQAADLVIFDSPPIEASLDAAVLAEELDGAVLVVPRDAREDQTVEAARALQVADVEFVGAVLYRRVRRSRKGAEIKVAPAPGGWGPKWPMLYEQPAQISASTRSAGQGSQSPPIYVPPDRPADPRPPQAGPPIPGRPMPHREDRRAAGPVSAHGPYAAPFQAGPMTAQPSVDQAQTGPTPAGSSSSAFCSLDDRTSGARADRVDTGSSRVIRDPAERRNPGPAG